MPFNPDAFLAQPSPAPPTSDGFNPDEFLRTAPTAPKAFDPDAFLGIKKPETPPPAEGPGIAGYGLETLKQVGLGAVGNIAAAMKGLAPSSEENRRLEAAITAIQEGKDIQEAVQAPPVPARPLTEEFPFQAGAALEKGAEKLLQPSGALHPVVQDIARGVGSVGGTILSALVPGGAATIPLMGMGEAAQTAVTKGATPDQQERAARLGTVPGMTDFVDLLLPSLGSTGRAMGLIKRVGLRALEGAFVEGGQEGLQQYIQNLITKGVYKPDQDVFEDVPYNAFIGAIVGGGTSAIAGGHGKPPESTVPTAESIAAAGAGLTEQPPVQGPPPAPTPTPPVVLPSPPPMPPPTPAVGLIPTMTPTKDIATGAVIPGPAPDIETGAAIPGPVPDIPSGLAVPTLPQVVAQANTPIDSPQQQSFAQATLETEIAKMKAAGELSPLAATSPAISTGREIGEITGSDILTSGPIELRPGVVTITPDMIPGFPTVPSTVARGRVGSQGQLVMGRDFAFNSLHSTTLKEILPTISFSHLGTTPVQHSISSMFIQQLMRLAPNQDIHIITLREMRSRLSRTAGGVYLPSREDITEKGPIAIINDYLANPSEFAYVLLHESTHAVTSNAMLNDPISAERMRMVMEEAFQHLATTSKAERERGNIDYGFKNSREFIAEANSNAKFQEFLRSKTASPELTQRLGLTGKPTLWESFKQIVRQIFGLPNTKDTMTLLEATLRVGASIMDVQARAIQQKEAMQKQFNAIEPRLEAVSRQPETRPVYDMIGGLADHIPADLKPEMTRQAGYADKMNSFYKWMVHAFQLGELNPRLAPLQRYLEKMREAAVDEAKINDAALRVMKDWADIGRAQSERLISFIDDITNMVYRTAAEVKRGIGRKPTPQEFQALVRKHGLNNGALDVFQKINTLFDKFLDLSSGLAMQEALKITDPVQRAAAVTAVQTNVANLRQRPYFPFMRYGRHVVLVRNKAGRVVHREHFERRGFRSAASFQQAAQAQLEKAFPAPQYSVELDILPESAGPMIGMPGMMLDLMAQKLNLTPQQLKALEQLRFEMSPAESFKHRFQNKSYIKGYSQDFKRSFANYFFHGAKWYVKTKYAGPMREDIAAVGASTMASLTPVKRLEIRNFMNDHLEKNWLNPAQDFITFKAGLVFYTLAYVPVSAAVNMSQVPMVSLPFLGAKFGDARALAALSKAIGTARNYYRKGTITGMTSDEARALNYAIQTGRLEQTLGVELASWAQGGNLGVGYGGNAIQRTIHSAVQKGMWMFSIAEKWNRRITFSAAYNLAKDQPNSKFAKETLGRYQDELKSMVKAGVPQHEAEATLIASHVVDQTQFMASPESRPRFMRGKLGSLFLYKRFMQGLLFLTANNKRDFAPRFAIIAMAMAGLGGLPGYDDLKEISRVLGWWLFGKDFSIDREIRRLVRSMTDEKWAPDQILHGLSRTGFGVPWLLNMLGNAVGQSPTVNTKMAYPHGPDVSRSIGVGTILPVEVGKLLGPPITDPSKAFGEQSARAGGVMGGLAFNFYRAIASKDDPGDFKRWELMMPRFAKNLSSAYRAYSESKVRGKGDTAIIRYDTRDPEHLGEIVGQAAGFQPRRLTAKWEELRDQSEVSKFYDTMKSMLLEQWATAARARDPKEIDRMRTATKEYNTSLPDWARGMVLTSDTINKSVQMRLKTQELQEAGYAAQRSKIPLIQEIQRLHPESVIDVRKVP